MEISKSHLYKHLHLIAIDQIADNYLSKGYKVEREKKIGKFIADLVASKDKENVVIEVKTGRINQERKKELAKLADFVNSLGDYKFKIVVARPPKEKIIEIADIENIFFDYLVNDMPSDLDILSTHTSIEMISDIEIHNLIIHQDNQINIIGQGIVDVKLQFGSDGDQKRGDGHITHDSFPFDFDLYLSYKVNKKLDINDGGSIEIDTDSYCGE